MRERTRTRVLILVGVAVGVALLATGAWQFRAWQKERRIAEALRVGTEAYERGDYAGAMRELGYYVARRQNDAGPMVMLAEARRRVPERGNAHVATAIRLLRSALRADPTRAEARAALLELYAEAGFFTELEALASEVLSRDADDRSAADHRLEALLGLGRSAEAVVAARSLAQRWPDDPRAHASVFRALLRADRAAEAEVELEALAERGDRIAGFALLEAGVRSMLGQTADAADALARAVELGLTEPAMLRDALELGDRLVQTAPGQWDQLAERVLAAAAANPELADDAKTLSVARHWQRGEAVEPASEWGAWTVHDAHASRLGWALVLGALELDVGAERQAVEQELTERGDRDGLAWLAVGRAASNLHAGDADAAADAMAGLRAEGAPAEVASFLRAAIAARRGQPASVVSELSGMQSPAFLASWRRARELLAVSLAQLGESQDVVHLLLNFDPALLERPGMVELLVRAQVSLVEHPGTSAASRRSHADALRRFGDDNPDSTLAQVVAARAALAMGDADAGVLFARAALGAKSSIAPPDAGVLAARLRDADPALADEVLARAIDQPDASPVDRARALRAAGRLADALAALDAALTAAEPTEAVRDALIERAQLLDELGRQDAASAFAELSVRFESDAQAQRALLDADSPWREDLPAVAAAIDRLRRLTGESPDLIAFESRRRLEADRTEGVASDVALTLGGVLREHPEHVQALSVAAEAHRRLGDHDRSAALLGRALDAAPGAWTLYPRWLEALASAERTLDLQAALDRFVGLGALPAPLAAARADWLEQSSRFEEAVRDRRALAASGGLGEQVRLAAALWRAGDPEAARAVASRIEPASPTETAQLAGAIAAFGDLPRARAMIAALPDTLDDHRRRDTAAARIELEFGDAERGLAMLEADARQAGDAAIWRELAQRFLGLGRPAEAARTAGEGLKLAPDDPVLMALAAVAHSPNDPVAAVLAAAQRLLPGDSTDEPRAASTLRSAVAALAGSRDLGAFADAMDALLAEEPRLPEGWRLLVHAATAEGELARAADAARRGALANPGHALLARDAAVLLAELGKPDDAVVMAAMFRERTPANPSAAERLLARIELQRARTSEAVRLFDRWRADVIADAARTPAELEAYAIALARSGRASEARALLEPLAVGSDAWAARMVRVGRELRNEPEVCRQWLRHAATVANGSAAIELGMAWHTLGLATGSPADRRASVELLAVLPPGAHSAESLYALAAGHDALGEHVAAREAYSRALQLAPGNPILLNNLAWALARADGDFDSAAARSREALDGVRREQRPAELLASLASTAASMRIALGDPRGAAEIITAADLPPTHGDLTRRRAHVALITEGPSAALGVLGGLGGPDEQFDALRTLVRELFIVGDFPRAATLLEAATELSDRRPLVWSDLAEARALVGEVEQALAASDRAVTLLRPETSPDTLAEVRAVAVAALVHAGRGAEALARATDFYAGSDHPLNGLAWVLAFDAAGDTERARATWESWKVREERKTPSIGLLRAQLLRVVDRYPIGL